MASSSSGGVAFQGFLSIEFSFYRRFELCFISGNFISNMTITWTLMLCTYFPCHVMLFIIQTYFDHIDV